MINVTGGGKKRKKEKRETRTAIKRERKRKKRERIGEEREKVQCNHTANPAIYRFGIFI